LFSPKFIVPALGPTQPHIQWAPGCSFPGVKQLGREFDYLSPFSAQVRNGWSCAATPPLCLYDMDSVNVALFMYISDAGERSPIDFPLSGPRNCYASSLAYFPIFLTTCVATLFI